MDGRHFGTRSRIATLAGAAALAILICGTGAVVPRSAGAMEGAASYTALASRAGADPDDIDAGNELRRWCRARKAFDECVEFFDKLVAAHPDSRGARYNAALAYIDKLPGHSILVQAKLSTRSIEHATAVIERSPNDWLALYIRGLNNLYWPKWYRRAGRTAVDMKQLVDRSEGLPESQRRSYMALAYIALGDAYALLGEPKRAEDIWRRGAAVYASPELRQRLSLPVDRIEEEVEKIRTRERPIDTDLSFYTGAKSAASIAPARATRSAQR